MDTFERLCRIISEGDAQHGSGASEKTISAAERRLGIQIRGGYRRFLQKFGWGGTEHVQLYGLGKGVPKHLDLVSMTESERSEMRPRLPRTLVPLMNDGCGNHYCIDGSAAGAGEPCVVFWDHELDEDQTPEEYGKDFCLWLLETLT